MREIIIKVSEDRYKKLEAMLKNDKISVSTFIENILEMVFKTMGL